MKKITIKNMKMPEVCARCRFFNTDYDYPTCIASGYSRGYNFNGYIHKMEDCPLEEINIVTTDELMEMLTKDLIITH